MNVLGPSSLFENEPLGALFNKIIRWKDRALGYGLLGSVDADLVWRGADNWYDALSKVTEPIGSLSDHEPVEPARPTDNDPDALARWKNEMKEYTRQKKYFDKLVTNGKDAARMVYDLRLLDLDNNRKLAIANDLGVTPRDLAYVPGRNTAGISTGGQVLDVWQTAHKLGRPLHEVQEVFRLWQTQSSITVEHWMALQAADHAQLGALC